MIAALFLSTLAVAQPPAADPLVLSRAIGHALIDDAAFAVRHTPWEVTQGVQVLDFAQFNGGTPLAGPVRARHTLTLAEPASVRFGLAGAGRVRLEIDGQPAVVRDYGVALQSTM